MRSVSVTTGPRASVRSANSVVELTVVNNKGFRLPATGENGLWMYGIGGLSLAAIATVLIILVTKKNKKDEDCA